MDGIEAARHYLTVRQADRALDALDDAGASAFEHPDFWVLRATALLDLQRPEDALDTVKRGLASDPQSASLHYLRAHALQDLEQWIDSESAFESVLALEPNHIDALADYSINLAARMHFERSRALVDRLAESYPESIEHSLAEAFWYESVGKRRAAKDWVNRALQKDPENPQARMLASRLAIWQGQVSDTVQLRKSVASQNLGNREIARTTRAAMAFESGSARWLAPGLRINPWVMIIVGVLIIFLAMPLMQAGSGLGALLFYGFLGVWIYSLLARGVYWWLDN